MRVVYATAVALLFALPAHAQAPLLGGFGGPAGYGSNVLGANDDGSSAELDLNSAFPGGLRFYGGPYTTFWVNNNGNITFAGPVISFTPTPFPIAARPMIAPYWADVDTRGSSTRGDNRVYWHLQPGRLIVTWHDVGYFAQHDNLRMDFQLIVTNPLSCGSGDFDVQFRYNRCEWTTGDVSGGSGGFGGTAAQAGFDAGNLRDFVEIRGSRTMAILDVCTTSNVGVPGVWEYSVRGGGVVCPDAGRPCVVDGEQGACAVGRTQCVGRETTCQAIGTSSDERCDGTDNDCDGAIDEAEGLCDGLEVCSDGVCVPPCFEGGCDEGFMCDSEGRCIEDACVGMSCDDGEFCRGGACIAVCEGIVCPHGQQCVSGRCTDLCDVLSCDTGEVCEDGVCQASCPCRPCGEGRTCGADGTCAPRDCDIVICPPGAYCTGGRCADACEGAICPPGQQCELGQCVEIPDMPMVDAGMIDAGGDPSADAGMTGGGDAGMREDAGTITPPDDGGCGCRATRSSAPWWLVALLALVFVRRRR
jgi:MYXO-CTERM domain-containing protein